MAYKILNGLVILEPNMLPKYRSKKYERQCNAPNVGFENLLIEPEARLHDTEKTFFYSIPKIWNQTVTVSQAKAPSADAFKKHFNEKN